MRTTVYTKWGQQMVKTCMNPVLRCQLRKDSLGDQGWTRGHSRRSLSFQKLREISCECSKTPHPGRFLMHSALVSWLLEWLLPQLPIVPCNRAMSRGEICLCKTSCLPSRHCVCLRYSHCKSSLSSHRSLSQVKRMSQESNQELLVKQMILVLQASSCD